jgi:hypothetical protein
MSTTKSLHDTVDPNRSEVEQLAEIVEALPTLTADEILDRHGSHHPFRDELDPELYDLQYKPSALELPGFGERREDCGVSIPHICPDCGNVVEVGRTCSQSRCPRCATQWVIDRAVPIVSRIESAAKMKEGAQYKHHVAVSPPEDLYVDAENPEEKCISMLQEFCREINFDGVILYHPYRGADDADGFASAHNDDRGEWKHRLFEDRDWEGDVREELKHDPHFHLIGACEHFPGGQTIADLHDRTGWVWHRITQRNGSPVSLGDLEDVARAVTYALSHVGIDTSGERNTYVHGKIGSAYHAADDRHHSRAREAVNRVAPDTLGITTQEVECREELPEEDVDDTTTSTTSSSDGDGDGPEPEPEPSTTTPTVPCQGELTDVDEAEFVEDDDWQQGALYADEAVATREEWLEAGGWQGWIGQDVLEEDGPPPD